MKRFNPKPAILLLLVTLVSYTQYGFSEETTFFGVPVNSGSSTRTSSDTDQEQEEEVDSTDSESESVSESSTTTTTTATNQLVGTVWSGKPPLKGAKGDFVMSFDVDKVTIQGGNEVQVNYKQVGEGYRMVRPRATWFLKLVDDQTLSVRIGRSKRVSMFTKVK